MKAGSRIAVDEKKRHPMDFVLWKAAKPGEPQWDSPWGPGRPGWHIECSVMSNQYLGATFDIHGGGRDLLFPHHENERAQSMAANQAEFARYWVHNGFVTIESEKMSKSLGNFLTIRDALETYHPEVLRLFLLSKHYRSPLDFSKDHVLEIQSGLVRIYRTMERMEVALGPFTGDSSREEVLSGDPGDPFLKQFVETMDDDLNTAGALGLVFEKIKEINRHLDGAGDSIHQQDRELLEHHRRCVLIAGRVLGFLNERPEAFFEALSAAREQVDPEIVEGMIQERNDARDRKDWASADEIRDRLKGMGIVLEDTPRGTKWRYG
jgi:cysteinyl-tRNA synthetase